MNKNNLIYKHEKSLFLAHIIISIPFLIAFTVFTFGMGPLILFLVFLFAQSAFICYLKGTGAIITPTQYPDIYELYQECCQKLEIAPKPMIVLLHGDGMFNAFATRFLRQHFVILLSDLVDAFDDDINAVKFYIGHELGHVKRNHVFWMPFLLPASILPILGAAYSRAREYTCDMHGRYCCENDESAVRAISALAVGAKRWKSLDVQQYLKQLQFTKSFWMSFHEIVSDYPWLVRRMSRVAPSFGGKEPNRNPFAWVLAVFIPRLSITSLIMFYFIFIVAAGVMEGQSLIEIAQEEAALESSYQDYDQYDY